LLSVDLEESAWWLFDFSWIADSFWHPDLAILSTAAILWAG
jgi:hypothetical protein